MLADHQPISSAELNNAIMTEPIHPDTRYRVVNNQVSSELGSETVILNLGNGIYYSLDAVGQFVWDALKDPLTVDEVTHRVTETYDVSAGECRSDMERLLADLLKHNLIEVDDQAAG
jgi:hypothetical protein